MSNKSMGSFIAALRKANGMTQKQLAEKLNVSDKAVSRWERNESAPDLSLIPVIAEIFGVTSDDILRGERRNSETSPAPKNSDASQKQMERIINDTNLKFSIRSMIAVGIGVLGLLGAILCKYGLYRPNAGLIIACIFCFIGVVSEGIFIKLAFYAINDNDLKSEKLELCKQKIVKTACKTLSGIVILFSIVLFLEIDFSFQFSRYILNFNWIFILIALLLCTVISWCVEDQMIRKKVYIHFEKEAGRYKKLKYIREIHGLILILVLVITFIAHLGFNAFVTPKTFADGTVFTDIEAFKEYIETPIDRTYNSDYSAYVVPMYSNTYQEEVLPEYIYDKDGMVIGDFFHKNGDVVEIDWDWNEDGIVITTYTGSEMGYGNSLIGIINLIFIPLYLIELMVVVIVYNIKRKKI